MCDEQAKGLLINWADIDIDYQLTYQKWHNCEHIIERVTIPGFCNGRRYRGTERPEHFIMLYETKDSGVLGGEHYLHSLNNPTPRTRDAIKRFRNPVSTT